MNIRKLLNSIRYAVWFLVWVSVLNFVTTAAAQTEDDIDRLHEEVVDEYIRPVIKVWVQLENPGQSPVVIDRMVELELYSNYITFICTAIIGTFISQNIWNEYDYSRDARMEAYINGKGLALQWLYENY